MSKLLSTLNQSIVHIPVTPLKTHLIMLKFSFSITLFITLLLSSATQAENSTEKKANYSIELLIFTQLYNRTQETWPNDIELKYPEPLKLLSLKNPLNGAVSNDPDAWRLLPPYFHLLADTNSPALYFQSAALRLKSKGCRILFHKKWQQKLDSSPDNIVISGGRRFGEQRELGGNITLNMGRYLHIATNLWFSQFSHSEVVFSHPWTPLPPIPTVESLQQGREPQTHPDNEQSGDQKTANMIEVLNPDQEKPTAYSQQYGQYWLKRTVLLKDKRRMRSLENHYIDHPKFGVLIRFTPIKTKPAEQQ